MRVRSIPPGLVPTPEKLYSHSPTASLYSEITASSVEPACIHMVIVICAVHSDADMHFLRWPLPDRGSAGSSVFIDICIVSDIAEQCHNNCNTGLGHDHKPEQAEEY